MANKFVNRQFSLTTTNPVSVYTCPAENVALVKSIQVLNASSGSVAVTASILDNSASATFNFSKRTLGSSITSDMLTGVKVFEENDQLKITSSHASVITGVVAILEQDRT
jgi:hypothetical protein|tara:strand:+ start:85 stop:414 length:330 start_codon:yes stop_codon:yes gene_type:complete